jgi:hypothetical protein
MANPTVPAVDQELPVARDTMAATRQAVNKKYVGLTTENPYTMSVGTMPACSHVPMSMPTAMSSSTAGSVDAIDAVMVVSVLSQETPRMRESAATPADVNTSATCGDC